MMTDPLALAKRLIALRARIVATFNAGNWEEVGLLSGQSKIITGHDRLLRSLSWHDEDYEGNVLTVLRRISDRDVRALDVIEEYLNEKFPGEEKTEYVSAKPSERKITFAPNVFQIPDGSVESDLVAVMMPFSPEFKPVYEAMKRACTANSLRSMRVDDMWQDSVIVQDIFSLIFRAQVVVVDFSRKNPNVMYETGIAHTLGKHVVPIAQTIDDVPFDMRHHRTLLYLANGEGLQQLERELAAKLKQFGGGGPPIINLGFSR